MKITGQTLFKIASAFLIQCHGHEILVDKQNINVFSPIGAAFFRLLQLKNIAASPVLFT